MYLLAVQLCRIYCSCVDLPSLSSVIAGMRGAKAVVSPPRRSPLVYILYEMSYECYCCRHLLDALGVA